MDKGLGGKRQKRRIFKDEENCSICFVLFCFPGKDFIFTLNYKYISVLIMHYTHALSHTLFYLFLGGKTLGYIFLFPFS